MHPRLQKKATEVILQESCDSIALIKCAGYIEMNVTVNKSHDVILIENEKIEEFIQKLQSLKTKKHNDDTKHTNASGAAAKS